MNLLSISKAILILGLSLFYFLKNTYAIDINTSSTKIKSIETSDLINVEFGIDRLFKDQYFKKIKNKNVAVIANFASRNKKGKHLIDLLHNHPQVNLVKIFTPEHGLRTMLDTWVKDSIDPKTGLEVISLYKRKNRAPKKHQLEGIDTIIFDLQDVGVRFYTYHTTLAKTLKSTKDLNVEILVLDRANPMGGQRIEGAVLEKSLQGGFANYYPITNIHGMTMAEMGILFNKHFKINHPKLSYVPLKNWTRDLLWDDMDYPWVTPSPALPTLEQAYLYSLFGGNLAGLNLAVGRGVENHLAFKVYGAPFITEVESKELVKKLNSLNLEGLKFSQTSWIVTRREYLNQRCYGFKVELTDIHKVDATKVSFKIIRLLLRSFPERIKYRRLDIRIGQKSLIEMLEEDKSYSEIYKVIKDSQKTFLKQRKDSLIYK